MEALANIFTPSTSNVFFMVGVAGIAGFLIGFILKSATLAKHKNRVIRLEDEMLSNHSRILELEKNLAIMREENAKLKGGSGTPKAELKVS